MGTLETPQDRHRYIHRTGPPEWKQTDRGPGGAGSSGGHGGAWSSGGHGGAGSSGGCGPSPHLSLFGGSLLPPPQNSLGKLRGIRSPSGLNTHNSLKRPWSLSGQIRHGRLACQYGSGRLGIPMIGWLDNNGSSRLA